MKLKTIWTLPGAKLPEKLSRTREWANQKLASSLPKRIRYWVVIIETARVARNNPHAVVPDITLQTILTGLEESVE